MQSINLYSVVSDHLAEARQQRVSYLDRDLIATEIIAAHDALSGDDSEFYRGIAWMAIRDEVRKQLNKIKTKPEKTPDPQFVLPGFERLQEYYSIETADGSIIKRIDLMTINELRAKADELRLMGKGCYQHAKEIEAYIKDAIQAA